MASSKEGNERAKFLFEQCCKKLLKYSSDVDDLLDDLVNIERGLSKVVQSPKRPIKISLSKLMEALIADKFVKHPDFNVHVALASCFSELTRITAPHVPYGKEKMKVVFGLIVSSFKNLDDKPSQWHLKRIKILETVAKVKLCRLMLDFKCYDLISEMFQYFLKTISEHHPEPVFLSMETIMILCLKEVDVIPLDLFSTILNSLKKDNEFSPIARRLGESVFKKCATTLKPYLQKAEYFSGTSGDYSEVLASVCRDASDDLTQNDVDNEITKEATPPQEEHSEETPKTNLKRKHTPGKEKLSQGSDIKKNDQNLVGKRVKVWRPEDNEFYKGVVDSFDSSSKKHKVSYDDGDEKILNFDNEKWEIVEDDDQDLKEGSHQASPEPSADMPLKKKGKANTGESKGRKKDSSKSS